MAGSRLTGQDVQACWEEVKKSAPKAGADPSRSSSSGSEAMSSMRADEMARSLNEKLDAKEGR
ncbi:hypothetical protein GCM10010211_13520 [Streptomyces albospinus]|uniref:Uncharacterized protein n=1 Tax=Streptomyces albospinus TaxID=285515 RepID=A0ABQ2UT99_9ACTN|nr:hypothetical protein [Streptomyces albospinus]GGU50496.1 hypothetical protein GCM10010211_13520 [Streptomyces albospinus]